MKTSAYILLRGPAARVPVWEPSCLMYMNTYARMRLRLELRPHLDILLFCTLRPCSKGSARSAYTVYRLSPMSSRLQIRKRHILVRELRGVIIRRPRQALANCSANSVAFS